MEFSDPVGATPDLVSVGTDHSGCQASSSEYQGSDVAIDQSQENDETKSLDLSTSLQDCPMNADARDPATLRIEQVLRDFTARFGAKYTLRIKLSIWSNVCCHSAGDVCYRFGDGECLIKHQRDREAQFNP